MANLSEWARQALLAARSTKQGSLTGAIGPTMRELFDAGLIGANGGLTRQGSILAESLRRQAEDAAFGGVA